VPCVAFSRRSSRKCLVPLPLRLDCIAQPDGAHFSAVVTAVEKKAASCLARLG